MNHNAHFALKYTGKERKLGLFMWQGVVGIKDIPELNIYKGKEYYVSDTYPYDILEPMNVVFLGYGMI